MSDWFTFSVMLLLIKSLFNNRLAKWTKLFTNHWSRNILRLVCVCYLSFSYRTFLEQRTKISKTIFRLGAAALILFLSFRIFQQTFCNNEKSSNKMPVCISESTFHKIQNILSPNVLKVIMTFKAMIKWLSLRKSSFLTGIREFGSR